MAFDPGFEIPFPSPLAIEFGDTVPFDVQAVQIYTPGFEIPCSFMEFGTTFAASGIQTFLPGFEIPLLLVSFGPTASNLVSGGGATPIFSFTPGYEIVPHARLLLPTDTAFEITIGPYILQPFPGNLRMTEILYPVIPISEVNRVMFKTDSQEWRTTQKSSTQVTRRKSTIRFRVDTSYMATFLNDLHTYRGGQFRLQTPGYTPFSLNSQDNYVRLLDHTGPMRERGGQTYTLDVTFLFVAVYP